MRRRPPVSRPTRSSPYERLQFVYQKGIGYGFQLGLRPQTMYGLADSPVGLAAYFLDHDQRSYRLISRVFAGQAAGLTRDDILDNVTLTWLTGTAVSSGRLYWENKGSFFGVKGVTVPVAVSVFPDELYPLPAELGGAGVSQAHPLQQGRPGRPLRGLGTTEDLLGRGSRRLQVAARVASSRKLHG